MVITMGINMKGLKTHVYGLSHTKIPRVPKCNQLSTAHFPTMYVGLTRTLTPEPVRMSGPECCQNPPAISSGGESGELLQIGSLNSYVSGNPDSKVAVLLVSDVFGNPFRLEGMVWLIPTGMSLHVGAT
ncbi:hypothetical protein Hdeb2414_s0027g00690721 [Helianthus debilis subsp. tardiflorus]